MERAVGPLRFLSRSANWMICKEKVRPATGGYVRSRGMFEITGGSPPTQKLICSDRSRCAGLFFERGQGQQPPWQV
jgi:hypothetical protein